MIESCTASSRLVNRHAVLVFNAVGELYAWKTSIDGARCVGEVALGGSLVLLYKRLVSPDIRAPDLYDGCEHIDI